MPWSGVAARPVERVGTVEEVMSRRTFTNRTAAWQFMADLHPSFDSANQRTAEEIVDHLVAASKTTITGYDEGNPGSSHEVRVHTPLGRIWVSPTRVWAPKSFARLDGFEVEDLGDAYSYLLPTRTKRRSADIRGEAATVLCPNCFISHPADGNCPFCGAD